MKGWRTILFNVTAALLPLWDAVMLIVQAVSQEPGFVAIIPVQYLPFYSLAVMLVNIYLRTITSTPVGKK